MYPARARDKKDWLAVTPRPVEVLWWYIQQETVNMYIKINGERVSIAGSHSRLTPGSYLITGTAFRSPFYSQAYLKTIKYRHGRDAWVDMKSFPPEPGKLFASKSLYFNTFTGDDHLVYTSIGYRFDSTS